MNVSLLVDTPVTTAGLEVAIASRVSDLLAAINTEIHNAWALEQAGAHDADRYRGMLEEAQENLRLLSRAINSPASSPAARSPASTSSEDWMGGGHDCYSNSDEGGGGGAGAGSGGSSGSGYTSYDNDISDHTDSGTDSPEL
jgi:hypothetical protein